MKSELRPSGGQKPKTEIRAARAVLPNALLDERGYLKKDRPISDQRQLGHPMHEIYIAPECSKDLGKPKDTSPVTKASVAVAENELTEHFTDTSIDAVVEFGAWVVGTVVDGVTLFPLWRLVKIAKSIFADDDISEPSGTTVKPPDFGPSEPRDTAQRVREKAQRERDAAQAAQNAAEAAAKPAQAQRKLGDADQLEASAKMTRTATSCLHERRDKTKPCQKCRTP